MKILLLLFITSCSTAQYQERYIIRTILTCPNNYSLKPDNLCHLNSLAPKLEVNPLSTKQSSTRPKKHVKKAINDSDVATSCVKAIYKVKQCGINI